MLLIMGRAKFSSQASHSTRIFACLYYAYHYVLVHVRGHIIAIYDSFNGYASQIFNDNIKKFKDRVCEHLKTDSSPYYSAIL